MGVHQVMTKHVRLFGFATQAHAKREVTALLFAGADQGFKVARGMQLNSGRPGAGRIILLPSTRELGVSLTAH
jgi:hypothetical protein